MFIRTGELHLCDKCVLRLRTERLYYSGDEQKYQFKDRAVPFCIRRAMAPKGFHAILEEKKFREGTAMTAMPHNITGKK